MGVSMHRKHVLELHTSIVSKVTLTNSPSVLVKLVEHVNAIGNPVSNTQPACLQMHTSYIDH